MAPTVSHDLSDLSVAVFSVPVTMRSPEERVGFGERICPLPVKFDLEPHNNPHTEHALARDPLG